MSRPLGDTLHKSSHSTIIGINRVRTSCAKNAVQMIVRTVFINIYGSVVSQACVACETTPNYLLVSTSAESPQMTVLNFVLGGTIFTEGGHYSPVNNVLGGQYSLVNNVRGDSIHR